MGVRFRKGFTFKANYLWRREVESRKERGREKDRERE